MPYNKCTIKSPKKIPIKELLIIGVFRALADVTSVNATHYTTYPVIMMFKSSNVLSVVLVGVCCTTVRDRRLKLERERIVGGIFITTSIFLF